jgi:hypothetical protein
MSELVFIYVNGIRTTPGSDKNWNGRAVTWTHLRARALQQIHDAENVVAERCEYPTLAVTRWLNHGKWVDRFCGIVSHYHNQGFRIRVAAHSNGANVALDGLSKLRWPAIEMLDLLSPACESDLPYLTPLLGGPVRRLRVWQAGRDMPLKIADNFMGRLLGFGVLGRRGPFGIPEPYMVQYVEKIVEPEWGHSTRFDDEHFDATMEKLTGINP